MAARVLIHASMKMLGTLCSLTTLSGALIALSAPLAHASSFTVNFCPGGGGCPANVSQARLTFTENVGTADPNDYTLDLKIVGGVGDPKFIDQVSFTINTADNVTGSGGYEVKPTLLSAPGGVADWAVFYDNVNNGSGCGSDTNNGKEVCAQSLAALNSGNGTLTNGTNVWSFSVDLADDVAALGVGSVVNLRAAFLNADGGNGGLLSPNGGPLVACVGDLCDGNTTSTVPEPASIALFGSGLLAAARARSRRRRA